MKAKWSMKGDVSLKQRMLAGMISGCAGGVAFAVTMLLDMSISRKRVNDFQMLAGFGPAAHLWKFTGPLIHMFNSATLGTVYAVSEPHLRGPGWLRGATFALIENTLLWPLVMLIDRIHPAIRSGELPSFNRPWPFVAENLRHLAYGLVLGTIFDRIVRRT
jgi:hypothetical protein